MAYNFDTIARTYDCLNRLMTLGLDRRWRRRAVRELSTFNFQLSTLDVACGTGDMCVELLKRSCTVTGVDLSEEMLAIARQKAPIVTFMIADAEHLPFPDASFDAVTCAFGVRNFIHLEQGLGEMLRVLKPGGRMVILELATPDSAIIRPFYNLYTKHVIPLLGKWFAGNREAYTYLPQSIERFPKGDDFLKIILNSQFSILNCRHRRLTFGVCRLYVINKGNAM
jgi:demethylmenaquinone methyltransferase/2-methoxy-6-polyprenyl-1,4-benzoquinol methylase